MSERVSLLLAIAASVATAHAAPTEPAPPPLTDPSSPDPDAHPRRNFKLLGRLQGDYGGEEIIAVELTDGGKRSLVAGQGITLSVGLAYQPPLPLAIEATIGYKLALFTLANGSVTFTRIPLDVIVSAGSVAHRVGIGATTHFRPNLSCNLGGVCRGDVTLDTAHGLILQYAYSTEFSNRAMDLGVRVTRLSYTVDNRSIDASAIGAFVTGRL